MCIGFRKFKTAYIGKGSCGKEGCKDSYIIFFSTLKCQIEQRKVPFTICFVHKDFEHPDACNGHPTFVERLKQMINLLWRLSRFNDYLCSYFRRSVHEILRYSFRRNEY